MQSCGPNLKRVNYLSTYASIFSELWGMYVVSMSDILFISSWFNMINDVKIELDQLCGYDIRTQY